MNVSTRQGRFARLLSTVAGGVVAVAVCAVPAQAAPAPMNSGASAGSAEVAAWSGELDALRQAAVAQAGEALAARVSDGLGTRAAGFYLDPVTAAPVVNVLDGAAVQEATSAGVTGKLVRYGTQELDNVKAAFDRSAGAPNTAWGVDPATDQVVLTVSDVTPQPQAQRLLGMAAQYGDKVRVSHVSGAMTEQMLGGDEISTDQIVCSVGFNVHKGGQNYILTAGHCTRGLPNWLQVGPSKASNFPSTDFGLIQNNSGSAPGAVDRHNGSSQRITSAGRASVGQQVCKSGRSTGVTCGKVLALNQSVDYGSGNVVRGLMLTNVRSAVGDSGSALFAGGTALGTLSGGNGTMEYFQPIGPELSTYGVQLN